MICHLIENYNNNIIEDNYEEDELYLNELNEIEQIYNLNIDNEETEIENKIFNDEIIIKKKNKIRLQDVNIIKQFYCEECEDYNVIEDVANGIIVCKDCGNIKSEVINTNCINNNYNDGKKDKTVSSHTINQLLPQSSTATVISGSCSSKIKMLHNWNNVPYKERTLNETFKIIHEMCLKIGVPKCIEDDAKIKFKMISDCVHDTGKNIGKSVIVRGDKRKSLIIKCVIEACNNKNIFYPPKKIEKYFGVKHTKGAKVYQKLIGMKNIKSQINFANPDSFINSFCEHMNLMKVYREECLKISKNVQKIKIASVHNSLSIATGSIFLMANLNNLNITKKIIASYFLVSEVTISKTYGKIEVFKNILINNELCNIIEKEIKKYERDIEIHNSSDFIRFGVNIEKINNKKLFTIVSNEKLNIKKLIKQHSVSLLKTNMLLARFNEHKNNINKKIFDYHKNKF